MVIISYIVKWRTRNDLPVQRAQMSKGRVFKSVCYYNYDHVDNLIDSSRANF